MKKYRFIKHNTALPHITILEDIICDICQNSCKNEFTHKDDKENIDWDEDDFTFLIIKGSFGYFSNNHDGEIWEAYVCEKCSEQYLEKIVCFNKSDYLSFQSDSDAYNDYLNKRANRIRKIRKMTGEVEFKITDKEEK